MGKGYQRKIDSIIDKMVEGNIEFNRKSTKQQDIDKVEISNNINNVIAILNDEGVKLVLNELDSIASQKSSEIFDSKGNINTSEVVKFTTNIVKSTIETAQRDGIDLTQNTTVKKNETIMETVFTVAMINDMIKNYDNLTLEEKDKLLGQYDNLSREQQIVIKNNIIKESQRVEEMLSESEQEKYKNDIEKNEAKKKKLDDIKKIIDFSKKENLTPEELEQYEQLKKENPEYVDNDGNLNYENMYKDEKKLLLDIRKFTDFKKFMVCYRLAQDKNYNEIYKEFCEELKDKYSDYFNANGDIIVNEKNKSKLEKIKENDREEESKEEEQAKIKRKELESKSNRNIKEEEEFSKLNQEISDDIENEEQGNYWDKIVTNEKSNNQDKIESTEKNEVIQLPLALSKANFSQEEIKEALSTYKSLLEGLDEGELNNNNDNIIDILYDKANEMQLSEKTEEILGIVLPLTYGDKGNPRSLNQMLMDDQRREEFFNQFDQIINQEIVQNQDIELDGELGNAINQYLSEKEENKVINIETIKENNDSSKQEITDKEAKPKLDREQEDLVVDGVFTEFAKNVQIQGGDANDIVEAYQKGAQQNTEKASSDDVIHTTMVADDRENENTGSYIESHKTEKNVRGNSAEEYEDNDKKQDEDSLESEIENSETAEEIGETDVPAQGNNSKIINFPFDYAYNIAKKFKTKISDIKSEYQNVIEFDKISQKNENELNNDENDMLNTM